MKQSWIKYYYDILDFYFWEPQHLGKIKNAKSKYKTYEDIFKHLKKIEVSLNHQLALFFSILPQNILNNILSSIVKSKINDEYVYEGDRIIEIVNKLGDFTQPDFLFSNKKSLLALEVKVDSVSSLDQFMKYLFLYVLIKKDLPHIKNFNLVFLAKDEFKNIWKEKIENKDDLIEEFRSYKMPKRTAKGGINISLYRAEILEIIKETNIYFINFQDLSNFIEKEKYKLKNNKLGLGWINFMTSLQDEFKKRNLIKN
jgi:hypothetical protein